MSIQIIHTCDRCKKVVGNERALFAVAIGVKQIHYNSFGPNDYYIQDNLHRQAQWCDECCKEVGILPQPKEASPTVQAPAPTLEEFIRGWIYEAVTEQQQGG